MGGFAWLGLGKRRQGSGFPDLPHTRRTGRQMGYAILTALFGGNLAPLDSFGKFAAPRLASAPEPSGETPVPVVDMHPTRGDWHKPHLLSHSTSVPSFTNVQL